MRKATREEVISRFREVHGERYDYSLVEYVGMNLKVEIVCSEHGVFWQSPSSHLRGSSCPKCALLRSTLDKILIEFRQVHGDQYDYSRYEYRGATTKSIIICPKHGEFLQTPSAHKNGHACWKCYGERSAARQRHDSDDIITRFVEAHGDRYDYANVTYVSINHKVEILCPEHGAFCQTPKAHINGHGCPKCADIKNGLARRVPIASHADRFRSVHGDRYEYLGEVMGEDNRAKMRILCKEHGEFLQKASDHYRGNGCPQCVDFKNPKANIDIAELVTGLGFEAQRDVRVFNDRRSVDVLADKLIIEHNGILWHSEEFHSDARGHMLKKLQDAKAAGYRLLHIMEDEWTYRRSACESLIKYALGVVEKLNARSCVFAIRQRGDDECEAFLQQHHIQGLAPGAEYYATLSHHDQLVMVASFAVLRSNRRNRDRSEWELTRMASSAQVRGGASKLMKNFIAANPNITKITTYCDHRLFDGRTYNTMGFVKTFEYGPDYMYVVGDRREHKSNFQKARIAERFGVDMTGKTERQAMEELGFYRIWDCGKSRYEWHK